ncbi:hypothetical protein B0T26DRAFT_639423 [Lasiosphaeria miniovina]|uniref:BZIP domain-containing protein n=1 Tax=Lasiosphaeria miniovina TaxID=1954250 RepID=A0AA40EA03_9PEZI|nr:uncharacterized protein B0T26DRAFT_639423 [Lasiosphaeria miniovina]KAK0727818.1 hypothetical protein B0T26DRAFT_639423 [Lasiosphaeria miniovina]
MFSREELESAASSPASAASSPTNVSTPTSTASTTAPQIAIRPSTAARPPPLNTSAAVGHMMAAPSAASPGVSGQAKAMTMTTREWVVPPRPKPGRKPATDTPPTKRKAQNRAAQRAFRERRAARVGELEELLDDEREEHERTVRELKERVSHLESETQTLQSRCQWLEALLEKERQGRDIGMAGSWDNTQHQPMSLDISHPEQHPQRRVHRSIAANSGGVIAEPRPLAQPFSISHIISPPEDTSGGALDLTCGACQTNGPCACAEQVLQSADVIMGCGNCTMGTRCACLEESIRASIVADLKRSLPPSSPSLSTAPGEKRQRSDTGILDDMETDFTALFASGSSRMANGPDSSQPSQLQPPPRSLPTASQEMRESCGFCKDGSYCVCADAESMVIPSMSVMTPAPATQLAHIAQQTHTPPPSEDDVMPPVPMEVTATGAIKLPSIRQPLQPQSSGTGARVASPPNPAVKAAAGFGCGPNGPGTCGQCLSDPKSGLFCRSLAANFERNSRLQQAAGNSSPTAGVNGGGCCGNGGPGGCCKGGDQPAAGAGDNINAKSKSNNPASAAAGSGDLGLSLSCADAYKTLASHRNFDAAADDIGSWLPKLRAVPVLPETRRHSYIGHSLSGRGRAPIEVEAASIMSVLKDFDIRFGRGE